MSTRSRLVIVTFLVVLLVGGASAGPLPAGLKAAPATALAPAPPAPVDVLQGSQPFLLLLCRLAGVPTEPEPPAYFTDLIASQGDGLNDYWREVSFGKIDLGGSAVTGWSGLPGNASDYTNADGELDFEKLASDCIAQGRDGRDLHRFAGLALVFNADLDPHPQARTTCFDGAGTSDCFPVIWMWPGWLHNEAVWAHEMGHVFGLPHSSDSSGGDYANVWDVMSTTTGCTCGHDHSAMPQHPIAYQLDRLGWIPDTQKYTAGREGAATIHLEPTSQPATGGYLMAEVPAKSPDLYYTVEARSRTGFDVHTPGAAVLIHEIDPSRRDQPAHLVASSASPLTAAGGMWLPGSRFVDEKNLVSIAVEAATGSGFVVSIRTGMAALGPEAVLAAPRPTFVELASFERQVETPFLGIAAGAGGQIYGVSARATALGISPVIQVICVDGGEWDAPQPLPSGWSNLPGDAPAIVVGRSGTAFVGWSGSDRPSATSVSMTSNTWLTQQAAPGEWTAPLRMNDVPGRSSQLSPALAVGRAGQIVAAWQDVRNGNEDIYLTTVSGGSVAANRRVNDDSGRAPQTAPAIAADANGNVEVLWVDLRSGANEIYEARRAPGGEWSGNARLAAAGLDVYAAPAVTADEAGNFYAAWIAYPACGRARGETGSLMATMRPTGGGWQPAVTIRSGVTGGKESRPVIATDGAGRVYLAWEERAGSGVAVYLATRAASGGWSEPQRTAESAADGLARPALAVDPAGRIYLVSRTAGGASARLAVLGARE